MTKSKKRSKKDYFQLLLGMVIIALSLWAYVYFTWTRTNATYSAPSHYNLEAQLLLPQVSKHVEVPQEEPKISTVTDHEALVGEPFFVDAQNGDKVLLFTAAKKAILYRPSTDKVVSISPLEE